MEKENGDASIANRELYLLAVQINKHARGGTTKRRCLVEAVNVETRRKGRNQCSERRGTFCVRLD